jgi:hypothetical protein
MKALTLGVGRALRETGQAIDRVGSSLLGQYAFKEELSRHRRVMPLADARPSIGKQGEETRRFVFHLWWLSFFFFFLFLKQCLLLQMRR